MQNQTTATEVILAKERLANAISRIEKAIVERDSKRYLELEIRQVVAKELDTYIVDLENLLLSKQKLIREEVQ